MNFNTYFSKLDTVQRFYSKSIYCTEYTNVLSISFSQSLDSEDTEVDKNNTYLLKVLFIKSTSFTNPTVGSNFVKGMGKSTTTSVAVTSYDSKEISNILDKLSKNLEFMTQLRLIKSLKSKGRKSISITLPFEKFDRTHLKNIGALKKYTDQKPPITIKINFKKITSQFLGHIF
jgi:hypothetical protein